MQPHRNQFLERFLKVFFELLYHQLAWSYDIVAWLVSLGQWNRWVEAVIPFLAGDSILEIGHGPGHLQLQAQTENNRVFGVDLSPQMSKICRTRLTKHGLTPRLVLTTGMALPFRSNHFSSVVATFPSEYITSNETLNEVFRVLNRGGRFIILPMAWITGRSLIQKLASWLFAATGQSIEPDSPLFHTGIEQVQAAGFSCETQVIDLAGSRVFIIKAYKP